MKLVTQAICCITPGLECTKLKNVMESNEVETSKMHCCNREEAQIILEDCSNDKKICDWVSKKIKPQPEKFKFKFKAKKI